MGLLGCLASFERLIEKLMEGIDNVIVHIDNLSIHSQTFEQHRATFDFVMNRLYENNIKINLRECFFATQRLAI
jgi:hypothetical protein